MAKIADLTTATTVQETVQAETNDYSKFRALFSAPRFSLPDRTPRKSKNGGVPVLNVDYNVGPFEIRAALWENEDWNDKEGVFDVSYSMSFPRNVTPIKGNAAAQAAAKDFRDSTEAEAYAFFEKTVQEREARAAKGDKAIGRIVVKRKPTETEAARISAASK